MRYLKLQRFPLSSAGMAVKTKTGLKFFSWSMFMTLLILQIWDQGIKEIIEIVNAIIPPTDAVSSFHIFLFKIRKFKIDLENKIKFYKRWEYLKNTIFETSLPDKASYDSTYTLSREKIKKFIQYFKNTLIAWVNQDREIFLKYFYKTKTEMEKFPPENHDLIFLPINGLLYNLYCQNVEQEINKKFILFSSKNEHLFSKELKKFFLNYVRQQIKYINDKITEDEKLVYFLSEKLLALYPASTQQQLEYQFINLYENYINAILIDNYQDAKISATAIEKIIPIYQQVFKQYLFKKNLFLEVIITALLLLLLVGLLSGLALKFLLIPALHLANEEIILIIGNVILMPTSIFLLVFHKIWPKIVEKCSISLDNEAANIPFAPGIKLLEAELK